VDIIKKQQTKEGEHNVDIISPFVA